MLLSAAFFCSTLYARTALAVSEETWFQGKENHLNDNLQKPLTKAKPSAVLPDNDNSDPRPFCLSDVYHVTRKGDTCDSIALKHSVASASIFYGNPDILDCYNMVEGIELCLPLQCDTYTLRDGGIPWIDIRITSNIRKQTTNRLNPWIERDYSFFRAATETLGRVLCVSPPGGWKEHDEDTLSLGERIELINPGYASKAVAPPAKAIVATGTSMRCGRWQEVLEKDDCGSLLSRYAIDLSTFTLANPSIDQDSCTDSLIIGRTYCVGPTDDFLDGPDEHVEEEPIDPPSLYRFGCYAHNTTSSANSSVLDGPRLSHPSNLTHLACLSYCLRNGNHLVFGLENGDSCLCGDMLGLNSVRLDGTQCDIECSGDGSAACGGHEAVEVFSVNEHIVLQDVGLGCFETSPKTRLTEVQQISAVDMEPWMCTFFCVMNPHTYCALSETGTTCTRAHDLTHWAQRVGMEHCDAQEEGFAVVRSLQFDKPGKLFQQRVDQEHNVAGSEH